MGRYGEHMTQSTVRILEARGLEKSYQHHSVLKDINLSLDCGVYAIQGSNGIGKSTLLGILCGSIQPDAGEIIINGTDLLCHPITARRMLSYVPDEAHVYPFLRGRELLQLVARVKQVQFDEEVLKLVENFEVTSFLDHRIDSMSLGTQKKFLLLAGFIGQPRLYIADEPSNGLDKRTRSVLAEHLVKLGENNTVLISSHDIHFISQMSATVLDMNDRFEGHLKSTAAKSD